MSLDDFVDSWLKQPGDESAKDDIRALMASHLSTGRKLEMMGQFREAIEAYQREHERPITTSIDAEIAQSSYSHVGAIYRRLGEQDQAVAAFQTARELYRKYGVGAGPHGDLAEILIEQGQLDEAILICKEWMEDSKSGWAKQLMQRALKLKGAE